MAHKVCLIMDAQGFMREGEFYPREVAVKSDTKNFCFLVKSKFDYNDLNRRDKNTNRFIQRKLLGIPLSTKKDNEKTIHDYECEIFQSYYWNRTKEKRLIGIKNPHFAVILNKLGLPWIDLDFGCPKMECLENTYRVVLCISSQRKTCGRRLEMCSEEG